MKLHSVTCAALCGLSLLAAPAMAHHLWLRAVPSEKGITANMIYGHHFPNPEDIPAPRLSIFDDVKLFDASGEKAFKRSETPNYEHKLDSAAPAGGSIVAVIYKPTVWSNGPDGWAMKGKAEYPTATYTEQSTMGAKTILVNGDGDMAFTMQPIGHKLEIVPMADIRTLEIGKPFPIKVLLDGKGLKTAEIKARFGGFSEDDSDEAYYGRTDLKGEGHIIALRPGFWAIETQAVVKGAEGEPIDEYIYKATLTFEVPEK